MTGFLGRWCLLEYHYLLCIVNTWSGSNGNLGLSPVPSYFFPLLTFLLLSLLSRGHETLALYLHWVSLDSHTLWVQRILCSWGHRECYVWIGQQGRVDMLLHISPLLTCMLHCPMGLHSQNTASKIQLLRISGCQQPSNKSSVGTFWMYGLMLLHRSCAHETSPGDPVLKGHNQSHHISSNSWTENS